METIELARLYHEAEALYESGLYHKAAPLYSQLAEANPDDSELERRYGICLARLGKKRQARAALASAVERGCTFPWMVHYELAQLHAGLEDAEAALDALEKAFAGGLGGRWELVDVVEFENLYDHPRFRRLVGIPDRSDRDRTDCWRHDLDFLVVEAQRLHPGLERPAYSEHFLNEAAAIDGHIPAWDDSQIVVALQRLLVALGDGHSEILFDSVDKPPLLMLPLDFYLFQDGLFVVNALGEAAEWIGARVAKIGAKWTDELLQALSGYVPADNQMQVRWLGMRTLALPAFLRGMGASDTDSAATLSLEDADGRKHIVEFAAAPLRPRPLLMPSPLADTPPPLYLQDTTTPYWYREITNWDTIYLQYNQVAEREDDSIAATAARLRTTMAERRISNLIVDVRHNSGGNNFLNLPLERALIHFDADRESNRLFVLIGRNTFSAAQNFVNRVERMTDAIFVSEPTGSCPNFVGETTIIKLPYSNIQLSISSRIHFDSFWGDERPWITPHIPVPITSAAYFRNEDPVLSAVLELIERGE